MFIVKENCRLCQKNEGIIPLEENISKLIFKITLIQVNFNAFQLLPIAICLQCNNKILETNLFISEIQNVNKCLLSCLEQKCLNYIDESRDNSNEEIQKNSSLNNKISPFVCLICSKSCRKLSTFKKHKKTHPELYCSLCKTFSEIPMNSNNHKCEKIERNIQPNLQHCIEEPKELGENEIKFRCEKCVKSFIDEKSYKTHLKVHNIYTCSVETCLKVYTTASSLKMHKLIHEGKRSYLCASCGKDFVFKKSLICHEKIHSPVKGHTCETCNVSFSVRSNLRNHLKRHHEGIRYHCSQCPREFITKCSLDRHELLHTGVKEFNCGKCSSAFYTKKELLKHQRYHQGLKQHKCEQCYKTFFERHHLIIHLRSHSGERPYVCAIPNCGKSFYDNQKLKRHQKAKHLSK